MIPVPVEEQAFVAARPWTLRDWIRVRLFPPTACMTPEAPADHRDCIVLTATGEISAVDRLRLIFTGRLRFESKIVTQHEVGNTVARSEFSVLPPKFLERL